MVYNRVKWDMQTFEIKKSGLVQSASVLPLQAVQKKSDYLVSMILYIIEKYFSYLF